MRRIINFTKLKVGDFVIEISKSSKDKSDRYFGIVKEIISKSLYKCEFYSLDMEDNLNGYSSGYTTNGRDYESYKLNKKEKEKFRDKRIIYALSEKK